MARQPGVGLGALGLRRSSLTLFESLKRLGGDEDGFGFSVVQQASNGIVKTSSYIRPFVFLTLGNVFPSEAVGQIVEFNISRNPGHRPHFVNFPHKARSLSDNPR